MKCLAVNICIIAAMMLFNSINTDGLLSQMEATQKQNSELLAQLQVQYAKVLAEGSEAAKSNLVAQEAHANAVKELEAVKKKLEEKLASVKDCR